MKWWSDSNPKAPMNLFVCDSQIHIAMAPAHSASWHWYTNSTFHISTICVANKFARSKIFVCSALLSCFCYAYRVAFCWLGSFIHNIWYVVLYALFIANFEQNSLTTQYWIDNNLRGFFGDNDNDDNRWLQALHTPTTFLSCFFFFLYFIYKLNSTYSFFLLVTNNKMLFGPSYLATV